ncbi:MAG: CPBP family intramembrane metalloprotease [Nitrospirota bacterium]|nr:MAG: CPBP family intramembrane metalloprotease [Nitrospirota bacterium]
MYLSRARLLTLAMISEGGAFLLATLLILLLKIDIQPLAGDLKADLLMGTIAALPPLALFVFSLSKYASQLPVIGPLRKTMLTDIRALFSRSTVVDILLISLCAGVAEELLFRGVLQVKLGIIMASVIFGLVHFVTPAYVIVATVMGLYMGVLFIEFDTLLVPIQTHFIYDLGALLYLKYAPEDTTSGEAA